MIDRVNNESDVTNIIESSHDTVIVLFMTVSDDKLIPDQHNVEMRKQLKRIIVPAFPLFRFIYINLADYTATTGMYTNGLKHDALPCTVCMYNNNVIARITNTDGIYLTKALTEISNKLTEKHKSDEKQVVAHAQETEPVEKHGDHPTADLINKQLQEQRKQEKLNELRRLSMINELEKQRQRLENSGASHK